VPQDCGKASAASWRSNASLRTRRS
jgi:hypothetical protein